MEPIYEKVEGQFGTAEPLTVPPERQFAETVCHWLLTAPQAHPFWQQFYLVVLRLTDGLPDFKDPVHTFEGSTHELAVYALNPSDDSPAPHTAETIQAGLDEGHRPPVLWPVNISEQFEATDDEMTRMASLCAQAVVHGQLNPDSDGRSLWGPTIANTLVHDRGHLHAP